MSHSEHNLIWTDLEMTGLDTDHDYILEIAMIITDVQLNIVAEGPVWVVHQPDEVINNMDEWNTNQHSQSGLIKRVQDSSLTVEEAEAQVLEFFQQHVPAGISPMCGSGVCQDRRFMHRLMPKVEQYFHYRSIDVSTIRGLYSRWASTKPLYDKGKHPHIALNDIQNSIDELKFYRNRFIII